MNKSAEKAILTLLGDTFTMKGIKLGFGHDGGGAMGSVYLQGKKAFTFQDDGWGGETDIDFANDAQETAVKAFVNDNNIAQVMWDNGWDFYDNVDEISEHQTIVMIGEALIHQFTLNRELKKILRKTKNKLVAGTELRYRELGFRGIKDLTDMLQYSNGRKMLQDAYDDLKKSMQDGERIFNTDEQLDALGIKR